MSLLTTATQLPPRQRAVLIKEGHYFACPRMRLY
jgi:hypothetical protein